MAVLAFRFSLALYTEGCGREDLQAHGVNNLAAILADAIGARTQTSQGLFCLHQPAPRSQVSCLSDGP